MTRFLLYTFLVLVVAAGGFMGYGYFSSQDYYTQTMHQLNLNFKMQNRKIFLNSDVAKLPLPVKRYFQKAIKEGQIRPGFARFKETGTMRNSSIDKWEQITAEGYYSTEPYGFLRKANVEGGFIQNEIAEHYIHGKGGTRTHILTGVKTFEQNGRHTNELMLTKFITYAVLFPTTLLPHTEQIWEEIDKNSAKLTLFNEGNTSCILFHFNDENLPDKITSYESEDEKEISNSNTFVMHVSNYQRNGGFLVPSHFEYEWMANNDQFVYGKVDISDLQYNIPEFY